jgi:hypothetical protein
MTTKITHSSGCAVHNAPAYEPGPCDCGAEDHLAGSGHTQAPAIPFDECRRGEALRLAADTIGAKDTDDASEIARKFVEAAKVYEAYLKGQ